MYPSYFGNNARVQNIFLQMINVVAHFHSIDVHHRDLKLEHFPLKARGSEEIVLAEFSLATNFSMRLQFSGYGTPEYKSPGKISLYTIIYQAMFGLSDDSQTREQ
ncbi:hypothetical protein BDQ12DRAFT_97052 [Crucibulum laeve]|uniref:Protein kinase domain-containing protein n=1 Tax=Crucibulum laeve TaxID=68775 RepID=A0A5C3M1M0_9AGAR|nr:hypothetical protein BDQ12DRAFT_97052 [Crucibulum laeve]